MSDEPGDPGGDRPGDGENPFRGTPFEALFSGSGLGAFLGGGGGGMPDLSGLMQQVQAMMQPHDGPINWPVAVDLARRQVASSPDPSPTSGQVSAVADAVRLADLWLDAATDFPSGVTSTAAWSRAEWVVGTTDVWKVLVEPMAEQAVGSLGNALPEQARAMGGPILDLMAKATGAMLASQIGQGLGTLAGEVLSASDIGLPLGPTGRAALVPANIATFAEGLDVPADDVLLYLALREAAHQRLFAHVPWLRSHLVEAVAAYARGIDIDVEGIQQKLQSQLGDLDPTNLAGLQEAMEGGLFEIEQSPAQKAALERLEVTLALVEGWVDEVVGQATAERMPNAVRLAEAVRRRRATGGPAEQTFATLVGLELRPRRLRDASTLWGSLRTRQGTEGRDGVWMHPDLLPSAADLDDPLGFREDALTTDELVEDDFDAALRDLLAGPEGEPQAGTDGEDDEDGGGEPPTRPGPTG
ncbi:zinc-dependent metalloprotease [Nocardioides sp. ChNu-153]|uniref:zinc-dependent metalloprotease n=1 Tax=unclassified Nocardioides TaxID=2615069 RepID=UPI0024058196|nr:MULTISPECIES: zinc-dependent metalloprotease [unclassified Nocardioides]MDF9716618.1 zinc-dependent metalloprotease [Nocardioides sp. ChNu-99]MDN7120551.1 zinc-dependent metalloprotease [Nocardioides sp. ChNu-153]